MVEKNASALMSPVANSAATGTPRRLSLRNIFGALPLWDMAYNMREATYIEEFPHDNTDFGAPYSYWNRQGIGLSGTGLLLKGPLSLLPDLRSSKLQGQANFVNPGLLFYNLGLIAKITPRLVAEADVNFSQFDKVGMLEQLLHQNALGHNLGLDTSIGVRYRPLLIENIILNSGIAFFTPASGFRDIYNGQELYSFFTSMTFTY